MRLVHHPATFDVVLQLVDQWDDSLDGELANSLVDQLDVGSVQHGVQNLPVLVMQPLEQEVQKRVGSRGCCYVLSFA